MPHISNELSLASLIERGGVYYDVPGEKMNDMLMEFLKLLPPIPSIDSGVLYREILDREALVSTGIGRGIALPHPRSPMLAKDVALDTRPMTAMPLAAIAFPRNLIDWKAPDGNSVHTVFLLISASAQQHLSTMSKISFLCQQEQFHSLIKARAPAADIIAAIRAAEASWISE